MTIPAARRRGGSGDRPAACLRARCGSRVFSLAILMVAVGALVLSLEAGHDARPLRLIPLLHATQQPQFSVSAQPQEAVPDAPVTVSFSSPDPGIVVSGCAASFQGGQAVRCAQSADTWIAVLTVPTNATEGPTFIEWGLGYEIVSDGVVTGKGDAQGRLTFTVLPPSRPPAPQFTVVARPQEAAAGSSVTVSFSPADPGVTITSCTAGFPDGTAAGCRSSSGVSTVALTVPGNARTGPTSIAWGLSYTLVDDQVVTGRGDANGTIAFTVLPRSGPHPLTPQFSVVARPQEGLVRTPVTVSFSPTDPTVSITSCSARFQDGAATGCTRPGGEWTAALTVPEDAKEGPASIVWSLSYQVISDGVVTASGDTGGKVSFTVLPSSGPSAPRFTVVARPQEAAAGSPVTVSFSSATPTATITNCTARFPDGSAAGCTRSGRQWTAALTVPAGAKDGPTSIAWGVSYRLATSTGVGDASGSVAFTVLSVDLTSTGSSSNLTPVVTLIVLILLAVFTVLFFRQRRARARRGRRARRVAGSQDVHAFLRDDRPPTATVDDEDPRSTVSVRLEPRQVAVSVSIDEARR
jgi:hypothetical protein